MNLEIHQSHSGNNGLYLVPFRVVYWENTNMKAFSNAVIDFNYLPKLLTMQVILEFSISHNAGN